MDIPVTIERSEAQIACPKCKKVGTLVTEDAVSAAGIMCSPHKVCELSKGFLLVRMRSGGDERVECGECLIEVRIRSREMLVMRRAVTSSHYSHLCR